MRCIMWLAALSIACSGPSNQQNQKNSPTSGQANNSAYGSVVATGTPVGKTAEPGEKLAADDPDNVTAEVQAMQGPEHGKPPSKFRKGHVTPMKAPRVKPTSTGFEVQFASRAPVVTPAVHDGKVYVSGGFRSREFHAFSARSGKSVWSIKLDDDGPSSPVCERDICVFNTESCTVFAVRADTGKHLWSYWLGDPLTSAPTIANGRVFTSYPAKNTADGKPRPAKASHALIAFDLQSGAILWQAWLDSDVMSAPVAVGEFVYVTTFGGTLIKLEQATGKIRYAQRARATSAPVITFGAGLESMYYTRRGEAEADGAEEMIIRADHNHPTTKYKAARKKADYLDKEAQSQTDYADEGSGDDAANGFSGGAPAAANPYAASQNIGQSSVSTMQAFQGSRILHLGAMNVNTMGDEVLATNAETGTSLWSHKLPGNLGKQGGFLGTAPLLAGESIVVATLAGSVVELDIATGKTRATYQVGAQVRAQPVVDGGWIYLGTQDGRLVAINTGKPALTGWPMWGGNAARTGVRPIAGSQATGRAGK